MIQVYGVQWATISTDKVEIGKTGSSVGADHVYLDFRTADNKHPISLTVPLTDTKLTEAIRWLDEWAQHLYDIRETLRNEARATIDREADEDAGRDDEMASEHLAQRLLEDTI